MENVSLAISSLDERWEFPPDLFEKFISFLDEGGGENSETYNIWFLQLDPNDRSRIKRSPLNGELIPKSIAKDEQKQDLKDRMKDDEETGLYNPN